MKLNGSSRPSKTITTLFLIGLIVGQYQVNGIFFALTALSSIVQISYSVYGVLNDAHDTYNKFATASTQDVFDKVTEIGETLDKIGTNLDKKLENTLSTLLRRLPLANKIDENVQELNQYITRIDSLFNDFKDYIKDPDEFDSIEVDAIVEASVSRDPGDVRDVIDKMHSLIVPGRVGFLKTSLLLLLAEETQEYALELCDTGAPPQQRLFELYAMVMITEFRGYSLTGFSYLHKSMNEESDFKRSLDRLQEKFELRAKQYILALKNAMNFASLQFRRCDPPEGHVRGESFVEFERFLQTFVLQETAMREDHDCGDKCHLIQTPVVVHTGCRGFECSGSANTCYGSLTDCRSLEFSATVCEFEPTAARRYQYIVDGNGHYFGDSDHQCEGQLYYPESWREQFFMYCDICRCTCMEDDYDSKAYHFVSLRPQESDIENNKIVTGVRFIMEKRILHIQIQEGLLEPNASISEETTQWKEVEYIEYDEGLAIKYDGFRFDKRHENETRIWWERLKVGQDISVLTRRRKRFFLDTLHVPEHHVVTGVKFARVPYDENTAVPIYLMIRYTEFDYNTGELKNHEDSKWMSYKDTPYGQEGRYRQELENVEPQSPLKKGKGEINSKPNEWIWLDVSSWYQDAGQTTLPLLDALPLYGNPLTPLTGLALYHRAPQSSGGFLTFVAEGLNKSPYIIVDE